MLETHNSTFEKRPKLLSKVPADVPWGGQGTQPSSCTALSQKMVGPGISHLSGGRRTIIARSVKFRKIRFEYRIIITKCQILKKPSLRVLFAKKTQMRKKPPQRWALASITACQGWPRRTECRRPRRPGRPRSAQPGARAEAHTTAATSAQSEIRWDYSQDDNFREFVV